VVAKSELLFTRSTRLLPAPRRRRSAALGGGVTRRRQRAKKYVAACHSDARSQ